MTYMAAFAAKKIQLHLLTQIKMMWPKCASTCQGLNTVLNVKALVGNKEKALVEAFSVIVQLCRLFVQSSIAGWCAACCINNNNGDGLVFVTQVYARFMPL